MLVWSYPNLANYVHSLKVLNQASAAADLCSRFCSPNIHIRLIKNQNIAAASNLIICSCNNSHILKMYTAMDAIINRVSAVVSDKNNNCWKFNEKLYMKPLNQKLPIN